MDLERPFDFSGKVAVITGGGGVLCGTMARALAERGASVAVLDLNLHAAEEVAKVSPAGEGRPSPFRPTCSTRNR